MSETFLRVGMHSRSRPHVLNSTHQIVLWPWRAASHTQIRRLAAYANPGKQELTEKTRKLSEALAQATEKFESKVSQVEAERSQAFAEKEALLWQRQEAMWKREVQRWQEERVSWEAREKRLLDQIAQLQAAMVELAKLQGAQRQRRGVPEQPAPAIPPGDDKVADAHTDKPATARTQPGSQEATSVLPRSVIEEASQFLPEEERDFVPAKPDDFAPLEVMVDEASVERVRSSLQAAFQAVESDDVLSSNPGVMPDQLPTGPTLGSATEDRQASPRPPVLRRDADDIFWVDQLHRALVRANLYPGEEEMEDWFFGPQTEDAVQAFQASCGLSETGVVEDATWRQLLQSEYGMVAPPPEPEGAPSAEASSLSHASGVAPVARSAAPRSELDSVREMRQKSEMENRRRTAYDDRLPDPPSERAHDSWPTLREGDGGREVHHLHVALERKGFIPDEEDQRWWMFGSSTNDCVLTFQACSSLPETGCVERETWLALLDASSTPASLELLKNDFEEDMTNDTDAVWLLGEQRWARRKHV